eukprot:RCo013408
MSRVNDPKTDRLVAQWRAEGQSEVQIELRLAAMLESVDWEQEAARLRSLRKDSGAPAAKDEPSAAGRKRRKADGRAPKVVGDEDDEEEEDEDDVPDDEDDEASHDSEPEKLGEGVAAGEAVGKEERKRQREARRKAKAERHRLREERRKEKLERRQRKEAREADRQARLQAREEPSSAGPEAAVAAPQGSQRPEAVKRKARAAEAALDGLGVGEDEEEDEEEGGEQPSGLHGEMEEESGEQLAEDDDTPASENQLRVLQIFRKDIEKWLHEPFFHQIMQGSLLRVPLGQNSAGVVSYRVVRVEAVERVPSRKYKVGLGYTQDTLRVSHGRATRRWFLSQVSNAEFTAREHKRWVQQLQTDGLPMVSVGEVHARQKLLREISEWSYTEKEIDEMVRRQQLLQPDCYVNLVHARSRLRQNLDVLLSQGKKGTDEFEEAQKRYDHVAGLMLRRLDAKSKPWEAVISHTEANRQRNDLVLYHRILRLPPPPSAAPTTTTATARPHRPHPTSVPPHPTANGNSTSTSSSATPATPLPLPTAAGKGSSGSGAAAPLRSSSGGSTGSGGASAEDGEKDVYARIPTRPAIYWYTGGAAETGGEGGEKKGTEGPKGGASSSVTKARRPVDVMSLLNTVHGQILLDDLPISGLSIAAELPQGDRTSTLVIGEDATKAVVVSPVEGCVQLSLSDYKRLKPSS